MGKILDYKCVSKRETIIDISKLNDIGLRYPELHFNHMHIKELAILIKNEEKSLFCKLPFCHTIEGEAFGGIINLGDHRNGPRGKEYAFSKVEDLLNLKVIDFESGRMSHVLNACTELKRLGENVVLSVSGPFTILNLLIDPRFIFKGFKKNPEIMYTVLDNIRAQLVRMILRAQEHGVDIISYGDSVGGLNIIGPSLLTDITDRFTYPLLKEVEAIAGDSMIIHLCPKTVSALIGTDKAFEEEVSLSDMKQEIISYNMGLLESIGKLKFVGVTCINNLDYILKDKTIKAIRLK